MVRADTMIEVMQFSRTLSVLSCVKNESGTDTMDSSDNNKEKSKGE